MKQVVNTQPHPVTPAGDVPPIPAHGTGEIDEKHPENAALLADGALNVIETGQQNDDSSGAEGDEETGSTEEPAGQTEHGQEGAQDAEKPGESRRTRKSNASKEG